MPERKPTENLLSHASRAEKWLLGALMLDAGDWPEVAATVSRDDFQTESHKAIFTALAELAAANEEPDPVTVAERLAQKSLMGMLAEGYLFGLADRMARRPGRANAKAYARIVRDCAARRRLTEAGHQLVEWANHPNGSDPEALIDAAERAIDRARGRSGEAPRRVGDVAGTLKRHLEALAADGREADGVLSGFPDLDRRTGGFGRSELIVIGGRPSMCKTVLMLNIAVRATKDRDRGDAVLYFSLENPADYVVTRILALISGVGRTRLRTGPAWPDWEPLGKALADLQRRRLFIDDGARTLDSILCHARRFDRSEGLDVVFVDALQVVRPSSKGMDQEAALAEAAWSLKALARDLGCPVVVSSYLNRAPERRGDRRPHLSDLRGSAAIEEAADLILLLYRDDVYREPSENPGILEITVAKNRNGPLGPAGSTVRLGYDRNLDRLADFPHPQL